MSYTDILIGRSDLEVEYSYDPGKPASGPYAPEYPTLEITRVKLRVHENDSYELLDLVEDLGALEKLRVVLLRHLEKSGELRGAE